MTFWKEWKGRNEEKLATVRRNKPWACPTEEVDRDLRGQERARTCRMTYGEDIKECGNYTVDDVRELMISGRDCTNRPPVK